MKPTRKEIFKELSELPEIKDPIAYFTAVVAVAHGDQKDKLGQPYVGHLLAVLENVKRLGGTLSEQIAALGHDLIEDTSLTADDLTNHIGLFATEVNIIKTVTKGTGENNASYIGRVIAGGKGPQTVKLADLYHNTKLERLKALDKPTSPTSGTVNGFYDRTAEFVYKNDILEPTDGHPGGRIQSVTKWTRHNPADNTRTEMVTFTFENASAPKIEVPAKSKIKAKNSYQAGSTVTTTFDHTMTYADGTKHVFKTSTVERLLKKYVPAIDRLEEILGLPRTFDKKYAEKLRKDQTTTTTYSGSSSNVFAERNLSWLSKNDEIQGLGKVVAVKKPASGDTTTPYLVEFEDGSLVKFAQGYKPIARIAPYSPPASSGSSWSTGGYGYGAGDYSTPKPVTSTQRSYYPTTDKHGFLESRYVEVGDEVLIKGEVVEKERTPTGGTRIRFKHGGWSYYAGDAKIQVKLGRAPERADAPKATTKS